MCIFSTIQLPVIIVIKKNNMLSHINKARRQTKVLNDKDNIQYFHKIILIYKRNRIRTSNTEHSKLTEIEN